MPCTPFEINGARGFLCTRTRRPRCAYGQPATLQCDAPAQRRSGTCDRHLCASCATEVGPDRHLCQSHTPAAPSRASAQRQQVPVAAEDSCAEVVISAPVPSTRVATPAAPQLELW